LSKTTIYYIQQFSIAEYNKLLSLTVKYILILIYQNTTVWMPFNNSVVIFTSSASTGIKTRGIEMQGKYILQQLHYCLWRQNVYYDRFTKAQRDESDYHLRHVFPSACNILNPTRHVIMQFDIWIVLEKLSRKFKFH
jgi:hypothetical protein